MVYCLRFEIPLAWKAQSYPREWNPFLSPPATLRAAVKVFEPASRREAQFILAPSPFQVHGKRFFFATEPVRSLCSISDSRMRFSLINRLDLYKVRIK
jgi:hypothetical protein